MFLASFLEEKRKKMASMNTISAKDFRDFASKISIGIQGKFNKKEYRWEVGINDGAFSLLCKVEREKLPRASQLKLGALSKERDIGLARVEVFLQGDKLTIIIDRFDWGKKDYAIQVDRKELSAKQLPEKLLILNYISGVLKKFI